MIPVVVVLGGRINLRVYSGPRLMIDVPVSRARAFLLAYDLLGALLPTIHGGDDLPLSQDRFEKRVARILTHAGANS